jgi:aconitate hydratase
VPKSFFSNINKIHFTPFYKNNLLIFKYLVNKIKFDFSLLFPMLKIDQQFTNRSSMSSQTSRPFDVTRQLRVGDKEYTIYSLKMASKLGLPHITQLPMTLKIVMENLLRNYDGVYVTKEHIEAVNQWVEKHSSDKEIAFKPGRVLMQDFTGVPAIVDLAAMRDAIHRLGGDEKLINPLTPVDLIIDHSVSVDSYGSPDSFRENEKIELKRNIERYAFLRFAQGAFQNFRVVPPGTGICHQVNLEYLGQVVVQKEINDQRIAYPDTLVGTDSHTTMINGLGILGWGVGGIEAEAAMLGQPLSMLIPEVVGVKIDGRLKEGVTATDLVLTVTQLLRRLGVVGKFVEFFGSGLDYLTLPDRATIANMSPEYGATCCYFPIDNETLNYLRLTGRNPETVTLVEAYAKEQGLWRGKDTVEPLFTQIVDLNLDSIEPSIAGPIRPQDKILLKESANAFQKAMETHYKEAAVDKNTGTVNFRKTSRIKNNSFEIGHGSVVIGAITSCTNTSNPSVMIAAGLIARKARNKGLMTKPWVKTSLAPGSKVVTDYLEKTGLQIDLDALGFNLVGYGCTTCIGNSGPLKQEISEAIHQNNLIVCSVLSGNRNFEGRINPEAKANYLASPPLVVAYSLAGTIWIDFQKEPIGNDLEGQPVFLRDLWPTNAEVQQLINESVKPEMFTKRYSNVFEGDPYWKDLESSATNTLYYWDEASTYVKNPPFFDDMFLKPHPIKDIKGAYTLALLGDSITTDHISPAGSIKKESPAGKYLMSLGIPPEEFNSYGSRRGNYEVMERGTFANIRLKNEMVPGIEGGLTKFIPDGKVVSIYEAAKAYKEIAKPLVVIAGKEYGSGSSRDWAAKGVLLLGIKAIIAESFERIHRSNLVGMGILPLLFKEEMSRKTLNLVGTEQYDIIGLENGIQPKMELEVIIHREDGSSQNITVRSCINTKEEVEYYNNNGILQYVMRNLIESHSDKIKEMQ